jgi:lipoyl(octanoyl) transferase
MVRAAWLGEVPYDDALALQRALRARVLRGGDEAVLLLEHPPVLTLGFSGRGREGLLADRDELAARGIVVRETDRGGEWTYHGPGQLVAYFLLALARRRLVVRALVGLLEDAMIDVLAGFGVRAERASGRPGVYVGGAKIGFLGLNAQGGATSHGLSLIVAGDLSPFSWIVPCGITDCAVTSIERETGAAPAVAEVGDRLVQAVERRLGEPIARVEPAALRETVREDAA